MTKHTNPEKARAEELQRQVQHMLTRALEEPLRRIEALEREIATLRAPEK